MASDIAGALGGFKRHQGFYSSEHYLLTWAIGHLVQLADPEDYFPDWKPWRAGTLPLVPEEFRLVAIPKTQKQLHIIRELYEQSDVVEIVNACDAGREGELIFRYIQQLLGMQKPVRRLWISSLTNSAVRKGFEDMSGRPCDEQRFDQLYQAARCRSEADWLVGINSTRAVTIRQRQVFRGSRELYTIGRVQTPTLAMIVNREEEIAAFTSRNYWELFAVFRASEGSQDTYEGRWFCEDEFRIYEEQAVNDLMEKIKGDGLPAKAEVVSYQSSERREPPPLLYNLTALQREANRRYSFTAAKTLEICQRLYEHYKVISYPRTDSRYLTPDLIPGLMRRLQAGGENSPLASFVSHLEKLPRLPISGRVVNAARVHDHHAVIPTEMPVPWGSLSRDERVVLLFIQQAFISIFYPDALWVDREAVTKCRDELFQSKASHLLQSGWREVQVVSSVEREQSSGRESTDVTEAGLAETMTQGSSSLELFPGQSVSLQSLTAKEGATRPPPRYSEGTLLTAMERAGSMVDDEKLREAMKGSGLGTPATRAAIIERLKQIGYIEQKKRELVPTVKGITLIRGLPAQELRSPEMTGYWETKLEDIEAGQADPGFFMQELTAMVVKITAECLHGSVMDTKPAYEIIVKANANRSSQSEAAATGDKEEQEEKSDMSEDRKLFCPLCKSQVEANSKAYYCSRWRDKPRCSFQLWKTIAGKTLTALQVERLLTEGTTGLLKGFRSRKGVKFDATLRMQEGQVVFDFPSPEDKSRKTAAPAKRNRKEKA